MKKFSHRDYINIFILIIIFLIILFSVVGFKYVNGSTVDWSSQHWIIPEYFRNLFYKTGDIFPSFAFNIGGGQNIYNLSYYGLLSPFILISYLFSFISMANYIIVLMILVVITSIILMYYWLHKRFETKYAFIGTLLFLLAAPLIYHTHRHIMFINYMPFLLMGLIGIDKLFEKNRKTLLIISIFLMIMTSYYYSVGGIIAILIYGMYRYIEQDKKKKFIDLIKTTFKIILPILIGVLMSGVLLLPTFYALLNGRGDITNSVNIVSLLIPTLNFKEMIYGSYTIGLTSVLYFAISYAIVATKKQNRFLSIIFILLTVFPIVIYVLSGFMYVRGKVLIPLLPIAILLVTSALNDIHSKKNIKFLISLIIISLAQIITYVITKEYLYLVDTVVLLIAFFLYREYGKKNILIYVIIFASLAVCLVNNYTDKLVTKDDMSLQYNTYNYTRLSDLIDKEATVYRVGNDILGLETINRVQDIDYYLPSIYSSIENQNYYNFANNEIGNEMQDRISTAIFPSKNILFNTYMGMKYLITNSMVPIGYSNIKDSNIYINENVFPIGYSTSDLMSKDDYDELSYPYNMHALISNIIINGETESSFKSKVREETIKYTIIDKTVDIEEKDNVYIINSDDNGKLNLKLNKVYDNKILFISFNMNYSESCDVGNTSITINGVKNTLSCKGWTYPNNNYKFDYVISSNDEINELNVEFAKGRYEISDVKVCSLDYSYVLEAIDSVDEFIINKDLTIGDKIVGNINVTENGYFALSIPYDRGFSIKLDNKEVKYEKVNNAFIGFPINEGSHEITINYISPYLFEGLIISLVGYMIFIPIIYSDYIKKKRNK